MLVIGSLDFRFFLHRCAGLWRLGTSSSKSSISRQMSRASAGYKLMCPWWIQRQFLLSNIWTLISHWLRLGKLYHMWLVVALFCDFPYQGVSNCARTSPAWVSYNVQLRAKVTWPAQCNKWSKSRNQESSVHILDHFVLYCCIKVLYQPDPPQVQDLEVASCKLSALQAVPTAWACASVTHSYTSNTMTC